MSNKKETLDKNLRKDIPSAVDDCADVTSKHERFKKETDKSKFPPVDYEKQGTRNTFAAILVVTVIFKPFLGLLVNGERVKARKICRDYY